MPVKGPLRLAVVPDPPQASDTLLAQLSPAERAEARRRVGTAHRHFVLGRLAAHAAIRRLLGPGAREARAEIVTGPAGEPRVQGAVTTYPVAVSISHVSRMAAACAWRADAGYRAGVDLERVRQTRVAESAYAFSSRERALLARVPQDPVLAGLAAWTVKEAAWKALWPHQPPSPATVQIRALSLAPPSAAVNVDHPCLPPAACAPIRVRLIVLGGPDGEYLLAVAEIGRVLAAAPSERDTVRRRAPEAP